MKTCPPTLEIDSKIFERIDKDFTLLLLSLDIGYHIFFTVFTDIVIDIVIIITTYIRQTCVD